MHAGSGGKSPAQQLSVHTLKLQHFFTAAAYQISPTCALHISGASQVAGHGFSLLQSCELKLHNTKENTQTSCSDV